MRPVTSYALIAVTILALAAAGFSAVDRGPVSDVARGARIFPGLGERLQQAARLELTRGDTHFTLLRGEKGWLLPDKGNYPARADAIRQALSGLAELEIVEAKTAKPELFSRLNLTDVTAPQSKATAIAVKDGGGATLAALLVGKQRATAASSGNDASMIYVRKPGEMQSWLAQGQLDLPTDAVDWAERGLTDLAPDKILSVRLTDAEGQRVVLDKPDPDKSDFVLRDAPPGREIKSQFELNGLAAALEGLSFEDVLPAAGMTMPERSAKAEYTTRDGLSVTVSLSAREGEIWAAIAASGAGEEAMKQAQAIDSKTTGWIYRLPDWKRQKMQTSLEALLKPKAPS